MPKGVKQTLAVACAAPDCTSKAKAPREHWPLPMWRLIIAADKHGLFWNATILLDARGLVVQFWCPLHRAT